MASTKTLSDFIKNHIRNLNISGTPMSYGEYKLTQNTDHEKKYRDGIAEAMLKSRRKSAEYGTEKERVIDSGLGASGYREYLGKRAGEELMQSAQMIKGERQRSENTLLLGYAEYLRSYAKQEQDTRSRVIKELLESGVPDYKAAFDHAINSGLSQSDAEKIAENVYAQNRQRAIKIAIDQIVTLRLDRKGVELYARAVGLNEEDTAYIIESANKILNNFDMSSDELEDKLEELEKESEK